MTPASDHDDQPKQVVQNTLFRQDAPPPIREDSPLVALPAITADTTIHGAALAYRRFLLLGNHSKHTIECFLSDMRLFAKYVGGTTAVGVLTRETLVAWLMHLRWDSAAKPADKTMARRVTFLKNYCGWLAQEGVLSENIAFNIVFARPLPPLPDILFEDELNRLTLAAEDVRSQMLITLALDAGLKKEEILALTFEHVDISDPQSPKIVIRSDKDRLRKQQERTLQMPESFTDMFNHFVAESSGATRLFECTDRNLTYILAKTVKRANIHKHVTLQILRDCFAVRQLQSGVTMAELKGKLGLSDEAWYETSEKYRKLAFPA